MKLYKYTRFDIGKQIIASSQIALSKPQDFNDPFDCVPVSSEDDLRKAIEILNGYAIDQTILESLQDIKDKINKPLQKALISFVLWEYRIARKLAKRKPTAYSPICTFEKFDKFFKLCERLGKVSPEQLQEKEKLAYMQSVIEQQEWDTIHKMANQRDSLYVAYLSAVYDSILIWSYYGQDHKGSLRIKRLIIWATPKAQYWPIFSKSESSPFRSAESISFPRAHSWNFSSATSPSRLSISSRGI